MRLAHTDKSRAFAEYSRYYMATDGQLYWSDTHQLSDYPESYHAELDADLRSRVKGSENFAPVEARRKSAASAIVTPMPAAGPLKATMTGFRHS